jgi:hypothetical protein
MWPNERREPGRHPRIVRPYVLTRGRTHTPGPVLALEASVRSIAATKAFPIGAPPESKRIVQLCQPAMSLAELAARLMLPVGVVRVLVADLAQVDIVTVDGPASVDIASDVNLLERLLDGIRAL